MIGISLHSRSRRHSSIPSPSGSTRSMIAGVGVADGGDGRAPPPRSDAGDRLEARVAQDHPQRAQDLRLVVADEDLGAASCSTGAFTGAGSTGNDDDEARPLTRQRLDRDRAAVGLDEALGDREPEARARSTARRRPRGRGRTARRSARARRRRSPARGRRSGRARAPPTARTLHRDRLTGRVAPRVLEQVGERPLELAGVGPDGGTSGSIDSRMSRAPSRRLSRAGEQDLLERHPVAAAARRARPGAWRGRAACRRASRAARRRRPRRRSARRGPRR